MKILSIQSSVVDGHVGNAASVFALQRLGAETAALHTVQFSNHPGHGTHTGRIYPAAETRHLIEGLHTHGTFATCDALLTGYIGDAATGHAILHAASLLRAARPAALWCCDPVMGDDGRLYVHPDIPAFFAGALHQADLLTPNQFELGLLTGARCTTLAQARAAAIAVRHRLRAGGPRLVLVTSLLLPETPADQFWQILVAGDAAYLIETSRLAAKFSGAGDLLAALFLFHVLAGLPPLHAAIRAAASLAGVLRATAASGATELRIVAAQQEFAHPTAAVAWRELGTD